MLVCDWFITPECRGPQLCYLWAVFTTVWHSGYVLISVLPYCLTVYFLKRVSISDCVWRAELLGKVGGSRRQKQALSQLIDGKVFGVKYLYWILLCELNKLSHTCICACILKLLLLDYSWQVLLSEILLLEGLKTFGNHRRWNDNTEISSHGLGKVKLFPLKGTKPGLQCCQYNLCQWVSKHTGLWDTVRVGYLLQSLCICLPSGFIMMSSLSQRRERRETRNKLVWMWYFHVMTVGRCKVLIE